MSIETLLLVVFFVVLPLIEMFRTARKRREQQERPQAPRRRSGPVRQSPRRMQTQIPPEPAWMPDASERTAHPDVPVIVVPDPGAVATRETMADKIAAGRRTTRRQAVADSLLDAAARREPRATHGAIGWLRSPRGLRRAMMAMAILGPCRAVDPHAWRESDRLR